MHFRLKKVLSLMLVFSTLFCSLSFLFASGAESSYPSYSTSVDSSGKYLVADGYDYSKPVKRNESVPLSYFDDAVILGDSRTVDLMIYTKINTTKILPYCDVGLNIDTVYTKPFVNVKGEKMSATSALKKNKDKFSKAYIMFGLNELGYASMSAFVDKYSSLINTVRSANKNAVIYVQAIIPVSKQRDLSSETFNNLRIKKYNDEIKKMCKKKKVFFLDFCDSFANCEGYLADDAAYDGIHFKPDYCTGWLDLLRSHTVTLKKENKNG